MVSVWPVLREWWPAAALWAALAAGLAWLLSRWWRFDRSRAATVYLKGFQYLLSGDPDAAIEVLTRVASSGGLEAYFALGSLFRRKGELDRAIQLHKNILLRPGLDALSRRAALGELGRDFRRAALWEEAAETLEAACGGEGEDPALREELREVYTASGRYAEAAACQQALRAGDDVPDRLLAHLWAEAAMSGLAAGDNAGADAASRAAVAADPLSSHARWVAAAVRAAKGEIAGARADALEVARQDPFAAELIFPWLLRIHESPEAKLAVRQALEAFLAAETAASGAANAERSAGSSRDHASLALARILRLDGNIDAAIAYLRQALERAPGFLEARQELGQILLEAGMADEVRQQYQELLAALSSDAPVLRCNVCHQPAREIRWRCPSCNSWDWL
jgi:lipopolysaccharide assembly protein B